MNKFFGRTRVEEYLMGDFSRFSRFPIYQTHLLWNNNKISYIQIEGKRQKNMVLIYYRVLCMVLTYFWMLGDEGMAG